MLPGTKCPMGPNLHISKMAAVHSAQMLIAINLGVKNMVFRYAEFISGVKE